MLARFGTPLTVKVWTRLLCSVPTPVARPALPDLAFQTLLRAGQAPKVSGFRTARAVVESKTPRNE